MTLRTPDRPQTAAQVRRTVIRLIAWHDALVSGQYKQTQATFFQPSVGETDYPDTHCCLSVANTALDLGVDPNEEQTYNREHVVCTLLGLMRYNMDEPDDDDEDAWDKWIGEDYIGSADAFMFMNDDLGMTFVEIADLLMEHGILPGLKALGEDPEDWV